MTDYAGRYNGEVFYDMSFTSPAAASTAVGGTAISNIGRCSSIVVHATVQGATGGTLDIYCQFSSNYDPRTGTGKWWDYGHFPQMAAAAAAASYTVNFSKENSSGLLMPIGSDLSPAIDVGWINGYWGDWLRFVCVAGASTTVGALQTIHVVTKLEPKRSA